MPKRKIPKVSKVKYKGKEYVKLSSPHGPSLLTWNSYISGLQRYDESKRKKR